MNVKIITFKNFISVICQVIEENSEGVVIKHAAEIIPNPEMDDPLRVSFAPFLHFTKESLSGLFLSEKDILCICNPIEGLYDHYKGVFEKIESENMDE